MTSFRWEGVGLSSKALNTKVARMDGVRGKVRGEADKRGGVAESVLAAHSNTGKAYIERKNGVVDAYVYLVDEQDQWAAGAIEFGRGEYERTGVAKDGRVYKYIIPGTKGVGALKAAMGR